MSRPRCGDILISRNGKTLYATLAQVRAVWSLVSENPSVTIRQVECRLRMCHLRVTGIMNLLERSGYISHKFGRAGRTPVIPLVTIGTAPPKEPTTEPEAEQP